MKNLITSVSFAAVLLFLIPFSSCRKENVGGLIRTELCVTTQHHERIIPNITVYLKYNAEVFPGYDDTSLFDTSFTTDRWGYRCFEHLPLGKHWLVGHGFDSLVMEPVRGSVSIEIGFDATQKDTSLYVSEY